MLIDFDDYIMRVMMSIVLILILMLPMLVMVMIVVVIAYGCDEDNGDDRWHDDASPNETSLGLINTPPW